MNSKTDLKKVLVHSIGSAHAIASTLHGGKGDQLVVRYGRAGAAKENIISRWKSHRTNFGHRYGLVLAVVPTK